MTDNVLIDLPELKLPRDLARRLRFTHAVEEHARLLGIHGHYEPARFIGYYLAVRNPVVVAGHWTVTLQPSTLLRHIADTIEDLTEHRYSIRSCHEIVSPPFLLVHDRHDESCWLWEYTHGRRFLEAKQPVLPAVWETGPDEAEQFTDG